MGAGNALCGSLRKEKRSFPYRNKSHQGEKSTGKDLRDIRTHFLKYFLWPSYRIHECFLPTGNRAFSIWLVGHCASECNYCTPSSYLSVCPRLQHSSQFLHIVDMSYNSVPVAFSSSPFVLSTYTWHTDHSTISIAFQTSVLTEMPLKVWRCMSMAFLRNIFGYTSRTCRLLCDETTHSFVC